MKEQAWELEQFERHRPHLQAVAYRMLGSVIEADDALQEAWLRLSKRGVFAYISDADAQDWQSSIDIVLRRFTEYHDLEGAFGRRTITERAKGILMERHSVDEPAAFEMLREHGVRRTGSSSTWRPQWSTVTGCCRSSCRLELRGSMMAPSIVVS